MRKYRLVIVGASVAMLLLAPGCSQRRLDMNVGGQGGTVDARGAWGGSGGGGGPSGLGGAGVGSNGVGGGSGATGGAAGISGCQNGPWCAGTPDGAGCCAPAATTSGCMALGGYGPGGCYVVCDFFCSTNWRVEPDAHGCPAWRYDFRTPAPGENPSCFPIPGWDAMPDRGELRDGQAQDQSLLDASSDTKD